MQFSSLLFIASAIASTSAASSSYTTLVSTTFSTIISCDESISSCPAKNGTGPVPIYPDAAPHGSASVVALGAAAVVLGAFLL